MLLNGNIHRVKSVHVIYWATHVATCHTHLGLVEMDWVEEEAEARAKEGADLVGGGEEGGGAVLEGALREEKGGGVKDRKGWVGEVKVTPGTGRPLSRIMYYILPIS